MRKILLGLLLFVFGLFTFSSPANANFIEALQSNEYNLESFLGGKNLVTPNAPSGVFPVIMNTLSTLAIGAYDQNGNRIAKGGVAYIAESTDAMYALPPVSGISYLAYSYSKFSPVSPAFAASPGQNFLQPIIKLWELNRNIAYLFFIIIFVISGFMIMFRTKLNPQTSISLQLALPNIVISLILVTFSFAISGFIVDLVFWANELLFATYATTLGIGTDFKANNVEFLNIIFVGFGSFGSVASKLADALNPFKLAEILRSGASTNLFDLIVAFTLFGTSLKIFFTLLTKYVLIIIQSAFSPFIFLFGALPTGQKSFSSFFKSLLSSALSFTGVYFVILLAEGILNTTDPTSGGLITSLAGLPPLNLSILTAIGGISRYVALGVLMTAPTIPQLIDKALGVQAAGVDASGMAGALRKIPIIGGLIG